MSSIVFDQATETTEGTGVQVQRLFPISGQRMHYDPFVLWDDFRIQPGAGFPAHPHRGFEAITYIFHGSIRHEDNIGNASTVADGGAQRFTAGRGIEHSEMPSSEGETRGIQLWINLPQRLKGIDPDYQQADAAEIPQYAIEGGQVKCIVGSEGAVELHTPVLYQSVNLNAGGIYTEIMPESYRGFLYVVAGNIRVGEQLIGVGGVVFYEPEATINVSADNAAHFMLCFGQPHGEPIKQWGPYVD